MSKLSAKHQVTIPIDCIRAMNLQPGDELEWYCHEGQLTAIKKRDGAADGVLKHLSVNESISIDESIQSAIDDRH